MATGACGINCEVCRLHVLGLCASCGAGTSTEASQKAAAQKRLFNAACPILACAMEGRIDYCLRDCREFPCPHFRAGPYPYSEGFLNMQERRRDQGIGAKGNPSNGYKVPTEHWETLQGMDLEKVCRNALARDYPPTGLMLPFFGEYLLVDLEQRQVCSQAHSRWEPVDHPLLELLCLVYLINAGPEPVGQSMVTVKELKTAHFFTGPHELRVKPLLTSYGRDRMGFCRAAQILRGEALHLADAAYRFMPFPKVPITYLLWEGDDEFPPNLSVCFDRSIEFHLPSDAIWGLVNFVSECLVEGRIKGIPLSHSEVTIME